MQLSLSNILYNLDYEGQYRMHSSSVEGSVSAIFKAIPQTFHRVQCSTHQDIHDARFEYFIDTVRHNTHTLPISSDIIIIIIIIILLVDIAKGVCVGANMYLYTIIL